MISFSRLEKQTENTECSSLLCGSSGSEGERRVQGQEPRDGPRTRRPEPGAGPLPAITSWKSSRKILMGGSTSFLSHVQARVSPGRRKPGSWLLRSRDLDRLRGEGLPVPERSKSSAKELAPGQSCSAARASDILGALAFVRDVKREWVGTDPAHVDRGEDSRRTCSFP